MNPVLIVVDVAGERMASVQNVVVGQRGTDPGSATGRPPETLRLRDTAGSSGMSTQVEAEAESGTATMCGTQASEGATGGTTGTGTISMRDRMSGGTTLAAAAAAAGVEGNLSARASPLPPSTR